MTTRTTAQAKRVADVDRLGEITAQIKELSAEKEALEARLRRRLGTTVGNEYQITVFDLKGTCFNYDRAAKLLGDKFPRCWRAYQTRSSKLTQI